MTHTTTLFIPADELEAMVDEPLQCDVPRLVADIAARTRLLEQAAAALREAEWLLNQHHLVNTQCWACLDRSTEKRVPERQALADALAALTATGIGQEADHADPA